MTKTNIKHLIVIAILLESFSNILAATNNTSQADSSATSVYPTYPSTFPAAEQTNSSFAYALTQNWNDPTITIADTQIKPLTFLLMKMTQNLMNYLPGFFAQYQINEPAQDSRLSNAEAINTAQDTKFTDIINRLTAVETFNPAQDAKFTNITNRLASAETIITNQDKKLADISNRLTSIEAKNTAQYGTLTTNSADINTLLARISTLETTIAKLQQSDLSKPGIYSLTDAINYINRTGTLPPNMSTKIADDGTFTVNLRDPYQPLPPPVSTGTYTTQDEKDYVNMYGAFPLGVSIRVDTDAGIVKVY